MRKLLALAALLALAGCHSAPRDPTKVVFLIESSPANLDPRIGTDGQSEHIDELLFDGLVARDASFHFIPALAERWEQPTPFTLVVPAGSGRDFWQHPVGTGPFRFVSQKIDQDVVVARNPLSWSVVPKIERVRFAVVPDAITQPLKLEKDSGDLAVYFLPMDSLPVLAARPNLQIEDGSGTQIQYLAFNLRDPLLKDARVRQAIACAIDRNLLIQKLLRGHAQPAVSLLPASHWAFTANVPSYDYDPSSAARLLDESGHTPSKTESASISQ